MEQFFRVFGIFGIICVPIILMFLIGGVDWKHKLGGSLVVLIFWFLFAFGLFFEAKGKAEAWNNGYCECGAHWELVGVAKSHSTSSTTKYYACPNCHAEITQ